MSSWARDAHGSVLFCPIIFEFLTWVTVVNEWWVFSSALQFISLSLQCPQGLWILEGVAWEEKTHLSCTFRLNTGKGKWRGLLSRIWWALKRNASLLALFVVITECDRTSKVTNITVLSWTATANGASGVVERGTSWSSKFAFGENRWRTSETVLTVLHLWNREVKLKSYVHF